MLSKITKSIQTRYFYKLVQRIFFLLLKDIWSSKLWQVLLIWALWHIGLFQPSFFYVYFVCSARSTSWHRLLIFFFAWVLLLWYLMFKRWLFKTQFLCFFRLTNDRITFMNIKIIKNYNICRFFSSLNRKLFALFWCHKRKEFYFFRI